MQNGETEQNGAVPEEKQIAEVFERLQAERDADHFIYSGELSRDQVRDFIAAVAGVHNPRKNVSLILSTFGGDAHAAYILAKYLKFRYDTLTLYILGFCKSAGTIIALGADEIVMAPCGELGPLDVQLPKHDHLFGRSSGLDIGQAITSLSKSAFSIFEQHFLEIAAKGASSITTHTAAEIASKLSVGIIAPITSQIDPLRVGEFERKMNISYEYGIRLNPNKELVSHLVRRYPDHGFVIDITEAQDLFGNVRELTPLENKLYDTLLRIEEREGNIWVSSPHDTGAVGFLGQEKQETVNNAGDSEHAQPDGNHQETGTNGHSTNRRSDNPVLQDPSPEVGVGVESELQADVATGSH